MIEKHWRVELAKSNRAQCKKCMQRIGKGDIRWAKDDLYKDTGGVITEYFHLTCATFPNDADAGGVQKVEDVEGFSDLREDEQDKARAAFLLGQRVRPQKHRIVRDEYNMFHSKKAKRESRDVKYEDLSLDDLKDFLRLNRQLLKGTRKELITRCKEMHKNGRLLPCPACGKGQLAVATSGMVECHGHWDAAIEMRDSCDFVADPKNKRVKRGKWLIPGLDDPVESEVAMKDEPEAEGSKSNLLDARSKRVLAQHLQQKGGKEVNARVLAACRDLKIALPGNDEKAMEDIDQALVQHGLQKDTLYTKASADKNIEHAAECAVKQLRIAYGVKEPRADIEASNIVAPPPTAVVPENSWIADEIDRLADLRATEKESSTFMWAVRADHRAAAAIRQVPFKITCGKDLRGIHGVGKGIMAHVDELLNNGFIKDSREIEDKLDSKAKKENKQESTKA